MKHIVGLERKASGDFLYCHGCKAYGWEKRIKSRSFKVSKQIASSIDKLFDMLDIQAFEGSAMMYIIHQDGVALFRTSQENTITGYNMVNSLVNARFERGSMTGPV